MNVYSRYIVLPIMATKTLPNYSYKVEQMWMSGMIMNSRLYSLRLKAVLFKIIVWCQKKLNDFICSGEKKLTELLIKNGANISSSNIDGDTALHLSVRFGKFERMLTWTKSLDYFCCSL